MHLSSVEEKRVLIKKGSNSQEEQKNGMNDDEQVFKLEINIHFVLGKGHPE